MNKLTAVPVEINWNSGMPIYASKSFLQSEADEYGWIGGSVDQNDLRCVLPYTIIRKAGFRMVRFRTAPIPLAGNFETEDEKLFLNSVVEYFRSAGAGMIVPSGNTAIFRTYPDGATAAPYGTVVMDLRQPEEVLLGDIRKTFRQNIRKASTANVQIKRGMEYFDVSYHLIAETMKRSGVNFKGYDDFKHKISSFGEHVEIFVAEHEGVIQGCMVAPFSQHTAYNCYAGSRLEPALGSMHLLHWEAIRHFRAMGVKRFDFQGVRINPEKGSKQAGILHYKEGFGGELVQGFQWKYPLRPLNSIAYSLAVRLLLGGDIVDEEHCKLVSR